MKITRAILIAMVVLTFGFLAFTNHTFAATEKVLHNFGQDKDGAWPFASLVFGKDGRLYGTTGVGGLYGAGTVFQLTCERDGQWTGKVLHNFQNNGQDGYWPYSSLVFDPDGNLYGTTTRGGSSDQGTVFQLTPDADGKWEERILYSFGGGVDGSNPYAGLTFDTTGRLYGTTYYGGNSDCGGEGCGIVFQLVRVLSPDWKGQWTETVLHRFDDNGIDGNHPYGGVIFDTTGRLYGTTVYGTQQNYLFFGSGTVYQLTPSRLTADATPPWTEKILIAFCSSDCGSARNPYSGLVFDKAGNLYGTSYHGGFANCGGTECGVVFEVVNNQTNGWGVDILDSFCPQDGVCTDGRNPYDSVILDADGNVYGTTWGGGNVDACGGWGCGTVFQLTPSDGTWDENILYSFSGEDGGFSYAGLIFDAEGNLYGTTSAGGAFGGGTVFEIIP